MPRPAISLLSDQYSSGCHVAFVPKDRGYAVQDMGSKNGTYINGRRVSGEVALKPGDEIVIGETKIVFDREFQTAVKIVDGTTFTHSSNTIISVRDIVRKPPTAVFPSPSPAVPSRAGLQQDQKFLGVLSEVSQALIYHMPLDKLLDHIMDLITVNIPMDRGVLMLREGRDGELVHKVVRVQDSPLRSQSISSAGASSARPWTRTPPSSSRTSSRTRSSGARSASSRARSTRPCASPSGTATPSSA